MYKQYKDNFNIPVLNSILRTTDNTYIPFDPDNTDYQAYLKWLAEGNTPLPADEPLTN
jgi:hypothetical protein